MSQENIELARRNSDAFKRGDWEALAASLDPHVLLRLDPRWPEQRVYGRAAAVDFFRTASESLGGDSSIEEVVDLGDPASHPGALDHARTPQRHRGGPDLMGSRHLPGRVLHP